MSGVRQFVEDTIAALFDFARVVSTTLGSRNSVLARLRGIEDGATTEEVPDCEVWGIAGVQARPPAPTDAGHAEVVVLRNNDEFLGLASRDLRWQVSVAEGELAIHALGKSGATQAVVRLKPDGTVVIDGAKIELGAGAAESLVKGDTFKTLYNTHTHPVSGGATLAPSVLMDAVPGTHLSAIAKTS